MAVFFFYFRDHVTEVNYIVVASGQIFPVCLFSSCVSLQQKTTWASGQNWKRNARRWLHIPKNWRKGLSMHGVHKDASKYDPTVPNQSRLSRAAFHDAEVGKTMNVHVNSCRKSCWCMWASVLDKNLHSSEIPDFSSFHYRDTASILRKTKLRGSKIQTRFLTNGNTLTGRFFI